MSKPDRPNIILIMADQMRFDCIGENGNPLIHTPNLDTLARRSANMQSCFVQAPVCVPSRQTIFTGRYPHSHRNRVNYTPLDSSEVLMQQHLKNAGYTTAFTGKLHYWPPTRTHALTTGFDEGLLHDGAELDAYSDYVTWLRSTDSGYADTYRSCSPGQGGNPYRAEIPAELHETTWCGRETRTRLRSLAGTDEPFFLFSSYWRPHSPLEVPEPWASMYNDIDIPLPDCGSAESVALLPEPLRKLILRDTSRPWDLSREDILWMWRAYYGAVSQIDAEVGETLKTIDELGIRDDTIVVFMSDHGDLLGEHGVFGKNVFYDAAVRVPLLVSYPGIVEPGRHTDLVETTDLLPTLFDLAGLDIPYRCQGRSYAELLRDNAHTEQHYEPRTFVVAENIIPEVITGEGRYFPYEPGSGVAGIRHPDAKMIRTEHWKYIHYPGYGAELYNLTVDPGETRNLAAHPEYTGTVAEMKHLLLDWLITADEKDQIAPRWLTADDTRQEPIIMNDSLSPGIWPTMITPFTDDGSVDYHALASLVEWYISQGVHGLFAVCQSSEMFYLSRAERVAIARCVVDTASGRCDVIASGHTGESLEEQREDVLLMAETGVDAVVLLTNRFAGEHDATEVWTENLQTLLADIPGDVPLGMYECPYPFRHIMTETELAFLGSTGRFHFLKDTSCDPDIIAARSAAMKDTGLRLYNANTATLLFSLRAGYTGFSGVMANFHPILYRRLYDAWQAGSDEADSLQDLLGTLSLAEGPLYPINAKYHLQLCGVPLGLHCRSKDSGALTSPRRLVIEQLHRFTEYLAARM